MRRAFTGLLHSRKFLVFLLDAIGQIVLYFGAKYMAPSLFEDVQFLMLILGGLGAFLIAAIAYEDGQAKRAGRPSNWERKR
jgi:hypothetical protein